ncbi:hypothetical protein OGY35_04825, partial [Citrobacter sp. Ct235]|uniref:hypothetical protein n=1 Tax=Citrobacter sp. Ct235 TaxID=2985157 RepID=UPI0025761085
RSRHPAKNDKTVVPLIRRPDKRSAIRQNPPNETAYTNLEKPRLQINPFACSAFICCYILFQLSLKLRQTGCTSTELTLYFQSLNKTDSPHSV